jgi:hypothetical protein
MQLNKSNYIVRILVGGWIALTLTHDYFVALVRPLGSAYVVRPHATIVLEGC